MHRPVLVFGYGNPSRGDDAVGPLLLEHLQSDNRINQSQVEWLTDFQLQVEHSLDLKHRRLVLFADAAVDCSGPFQFDQLQPERDTSFTTHAMSPAAVLQVYLDIEKAEPPPVFLLRIEAEQFELGEGLSQNATENLRLATDFARRLLMTPELEAWQRLTAN